MSTVEITQQLHLHNPELVTAGDVRSASERIQAELELLGREFSKVEDQIAVLKTTIHGLALILDTCSFRAELLPSDRPRTRRNIRGLSQACRFVLRNAIRPCSVSAVCTLVTALNPELLIHHRNPLASITSALRTLARRGHVVRNIENGKSVWQWVPSSRPRLRETFELENECVLDQTPQASSISTAA